MASLKQPIPKTDKRLDPDGSRRMVFVASFETLQQKHSYQVWDKKSKKGLTTQTFSEWDYNLNDSFWAVAIDEAHQLKQAWSGRKNVTVTSIRTWGRIAITGTPIVQDVGDAASLAGLILPRTNLWAGLNVSKTTDPYTSADGTPEAILQATGEGIMGFIKGQGDIEAGRCIHRAFQQILLSRKYSGQDPDSNSWQ